MNGRRQLPVFSLTGAHKKTASVVNAVPLRNLYNVELLNDYLLLHIGSARFFNFQLVHAFGEQMLYGKCFCCITADDI